MQALKLNLMSVRRVGLAGFGLVASLDLVATWLLTPLLRLVTTFLLEQAAIPFVSVANVVTLLTTHPLIVCALLVEVWVVLALLGLQVLVAFSGLRLLVAGRFSFAGWLALPPAGGDLRLAGCLGLGAVVDRGDADCDPVVSDPAVGQHQGRRLYPRLPNQAAKLNDWRRVGLRSLLVHRGALAVLGTGEEGAGPGPLVGGVVLARQRVGGVG